MDNKTFNLTHEQRIQKMLEETLHQRLLAHIESTEHTAMTKTASILYELGLLIALVSRLAANDSMIEGDLYRLLDLYTQ